MNGLRLDEVKLAFRDKVLEALDAAAKEHLQMDLGALDKDLPYLFKTIDDQVERLAERQNT